MIKTRFETARSHPDGYRVFEVDMPYPVRVGEELEIEETGRNFTVTSVTWVLSEELNVITELIAKVR